MDMPITLATHYRVNAPDRRIADFVGGLDDARIARTIKYRRVSSPQQIGQQLPPALAHWFNRQTHHRGQIRALLTALVGEAPELDLLIPAAVGNPGELKSR
jgi:uncharacterized damage-inducible protein DinB